MLGSRKEKAGEKCTPICSKYVSNGCFDILSETAAMRVTFYGQRRIVATIQIMGLYCIQTFFS